MGSYKANYLISNTPIDFRSVFKTFILLMKYQCYCFSGIFYAFIIGLYP
ncbi:hypothetical protein HMPREF9071_0907 [Capnocytophaga sp. oral taxon 338 str. F0234]|nr:hypothetical protein HMPREF9071_0907 [Capnocytophaga sp. oral taxon 338 str. F0234]